MRPCQQSSPVCITHLQALKRLQSILQVYSDRQPQHFDDGAERRLQCRPPAPSGYHLEVSSTLCTFFSGRERMEDASDIHPTGRAVSLSKTNTRRLPDCTEHGSNYAGSSRVRNKRAAHRPYFCQQFYLTYLDTNANSAWLTGTLAGLLGIRIISTLLPQRNDLLLETFIPSLAQSVTPFTNPCSLHFFSFAYFNS